MTTPSRTILLVIFTENRIIMKSKIPKYERYSGALLGLAAGDALGTSIEFSAPGTFEPLTEIAGGGPFNLSPGQWTDDTSMALCLADSLIECAGFSAIDQMDRYVRWWKEGYNSSKNNCFDIGATISAALNKYIRDGNPYAGNTHPQSAGNGSIMRLAPIPMYYCNSPGDAILKASDSSKTTHSAQTTIDACRYMCSIIVGALNGVDKDELLSKHYTPIPDYWNNNPLCTEIDEIASGSFKLKEPPVIKGTGYVVESLEAALWAFNKNDNFKEGCLSAVNLGDDADTTGAIYGQIAGAYYGVDQIPQNWRKILTKHEHIVKIANILYENRVS